MLPEDGLRRCQVLESLGQRHILQSRALLKEKGKNRHCKRKSSGLWAGGTDTLISLFKR
jgi:hypothetical protein